MRSLRIWFSSLTTLSSDRREAASSYREPVIEAMWREDVDVDGVHACGLPCPVGGPSGGCALVFWLESIANSSLAGELALVGDEVVWESCLLIFSRTEP